MESKFDGGLLGLIGVNLLTCLVSLITLTIACLGWFVTKRGGFPDIP